MLASFAQAASTDDAPLRLVTGDDYGPFTDRNMEQGGLFSFLVKGIYGEMGRRVSIDVEPWKRGYVETLRGNFDGTFPYIQTDERDAVFYLSQPVLKSTSHLFIRRADRFRLQTSEDFKGVTTCLPVGYAFDYEMEEFILRGDVQVTRPADFSTCVQALMNGRVDFINMNNLTFAWTVKKLGGTMTSFAAMGDGRAGAEHFVMFPKTGEGAKADRDAFNATLKAMKEDGRFDILLREYAPKIGLPESYILSNN